MEESFHLLHPNHRPHTRGKLCKLGTQVRTLQFQLLMIRVFHKWTVTADTKRGTFGIGFHTPYGAGKNDVCQLCLSTLFGMLML